MVNIEWAAVEAIASVAGVIGVVISVIFLIYEVRHNARAIEGSTVQSLMSLEREVFSLLADNAELMTKGGADFASLSDAERYQYERVSGSYLSLVYSAFIQHERNLIEDEVWEAYFNALKRHIQEYGLKDVWENIKVGYPKSFQEAILSLFQNPKSDDPKLT